MPTPLVYRSALAGEGLASRRRSLARALAEPLHAAATQIVEPLRGFATAVAAISWFPALTAARTTAA